MWTFRAVSSSCCCGSAVAAGIVAVCVVVDIMVSGFRTYNVVVFASAESLAETLSYRAQECL